MFYNKSKIQGKLKIHVLGFSPIIAALILLALSMFNYAYAHGVSGGFSPRQPNMALTLPMLGASAFDIIAVVVRRIRILVGIALVVGSLIGFALVNFELTRLGYQTDEFHSLTKLYYQILQYSVGVLILALVGSLVFVGYCMIARYPLRKQVRC